MLAREKAVLGFYVTKHPLASHADQLNAGSTSRTVDLSAFEEGARVVLGGMVSNMRTVVTRGGRNPGKKLGIVTLEDLHGRVEAIVFPDQLERDRALLAPDAIVFLEGEVDRKREEPSLRVSRVIPADQAYHQLARALLIDVPRDVPLDALMTLIREHLVSAVLRRAQGNGDDVAAFNPTKASSRTRGFSGGARTRTDEPPGCPVYFNVETDDALQVQIECNRAFRVFPSPQLFEALFSMIGRNRIHVVGPREDALLPTPPQPSRVSA